MLKPTTTLATSGPRTIPTALTLAPGEHAFLSILAKRWGCAPEAVAMCLLSIELQRRFDAEPAPAPAPKTAAATAVAAPPKIAAMIAHPLLTGPYAPTAAKSKGAIRHG
ncbi:hypothetical protein [uncultured Thiodictyon sp.]|uniref:hypothetical protein n=1 Tax=uncultured Thiodictyon sp. TaxID=1846217 RepID=UPI0025F2400B|nr:hypothetical protein [uncultured Thiodictyon sp.]